MIYMCGNTWLPRALSIDYIPKIMLQVQHHKNFMSCHNYNNKILNLLLAVIVIVVTQFHTQSITGIQYLVLSCSEENGQWRQFLVSTKTGNEAIEKTEPNIGASCLPCGQMEFGK